jgi:hypothetical protein
MPSDNLLNHLNQLAELYGQRQKTATALQAAFKLVANAHVKTAKVLRDYGELDAAVDVGAAQSAFAQLRLKEETMDPLAPELRREVKKLTAINGALKDAASALRSEPVDVVRLDKALAVLQESGEQSVVEVAPELQQELDLAQRALGDEFGQRLRSALADQGIAIGGRPPKFEIQRFELEANFARRYCVLRYGKEVVAPHVPITVDATLKAYQSAVKSIAGRNQDGAAWLAQLHDAYQVARRKRSAHGMRVNIVEAYVEMVILRQGRAFASEPSKRTFVDYSRAQFIYDFYEFTGRQRQTFEGHAVKAHGATKSQTDNPAKSMWIVEGDTPYDGRYIADIEFVKE